MAGPDGFSSAMNSMVFYDAIILFLPLILVFGTTVFLIYYSLGKAGFLDSFDERIEKFVRIGLAVVIGASASLILRILLFNFGI